MNFAQLFDRARLMLTSPKTQWPVVEAAPETSAALFRDYIVWMAAIPPVAAFLGSVLFGYELPLGGRVRVGFGTGLVTLAGTYLLSLALVWVLALIVDALAPSFGGRKDQVQALKAVTYSATASWVAGIGALIPGLGGLIQLAGGLYGIYLLYLGLPVTMKCPPEKAAGYTAVVVVLVILLGVVLGAVFGAVGGTRYGFG